MYRIYIPIGGAAAWNPKLVRIWEGSSLDYPAALARCESRYGLCYTETI